MPVWEEGMLVGQVCKVALETHKRQSQQWLLSLAPRLWPKTFMHTLPVWDANLWKEPVPSPPTQAVALCCVTRCPISLLLTGSRPSSHSHPSQTQPHILRDLASSAHPGQTLHVPAKCIPWPCRWPGTSGTNLAD